MNTINDSYKTLRRIVGIIGISLPFVLAIFGFFIFGRIHIAPSISDYYAFRTRDIFVGSLFTIGWFLFTYNGYDNRDRVAGKIAGVSALLVALFPVTKINWEHTIHLGAASVLFLTLAYFSYFLFTLSNTSIPTLQKLTRNKIYRGCGITIAASVILIIVDEFLKEQSFNPIFWLETIALLAFGISWFTKGETIFKDT